MPRSSAMPVTLSQARSGPVVSGLAVLVGVVVVAVAAQVALPMQPVPMTLHTFAMFVIASVCGARIGVMVAVGYFVAAWCGLPVLSDGGSFDEHGLLGTRTAGYVLAFVPTCWLFGALVDRFPRGTFWLLLSAALLAHALVLVIGAAWLAAHVGVVAAFEHGVLPFWLGAMVKSAAVAAVVAGLRQLLVRGAADRIRR